MFHNGLLEETKALLDAGFSPQSKALESLGYKQAVRVLTAQSTLEESILECQLRTRQYAKRQTTWFRREPGVVWLDGFGTQQDIRDQALELTRAFLARFGVVR
jgi:tRNA dimethylallyltransferase